MKKLILILVFVLGFALQGWSTTYNIGPGETYETFAALGAAVVLVGDDIVDGGNNTFREKWTIQTSGTEGHPITFQNATISGAQIIANVGFTKVGGYTNVYAVSFNLDAFGGTNLEPMVWENDQRLTEQSYVGYVDANPGSFYYIQGTTTMYIHASDSSSVISNTKVYEFPLTTENIQTNNQEYLVFDNTDCTKTSGDDGNSVGGISETGDNNIYKNLSTWDHRRHAFSFYQTANNNEAYNIRAYDTWVSGAVIFFGSAADSTTNNVFRDSVIYNGSYGVVNFHGGATGNEIRDSIIYMENGYYSGSQPLIKVSAASNILRNNYIYGYSNLNAVAFDAAPNCKMIGNIIDAEDITQYTVNILNNSTGLLFYHNVLKNGNVTYYHFQVGSAGCKLKNNIIYDSARFIYVVSGNDTGFESNYNFIHNISTRVGNWLGAGAITFTNWQTVSGHDANSSEDDPQIQSNGKLFSTSPCIDMGTWIVGENMEGQEDKWGKGVYKLPNIGVDQGAGAPKGATRILRIGGGGGIN